MCCANMMPVAGAGGIRRFDSLAVAGIGVVTVAVLAAACAVAADVPAAIAPQPIISRGVPAYASSGTASYGNNATYAQEGKWIADCEWTVFSSPAWLAYDLSGAAAADRAKILVVWYGGGQAYDCSIIKGSSYRMPGPYVIEGNRAPGGQRVRPRQVG